VQNIHVLLQIYFLSPREKLLFQNNEDLTGNKNEDSIKELKLKISMRLKLKKT